MPFEEPGSRARMIACTVAALLGFAANSLLCRMALGPRLTDPATFTAARLVAGALMLLLLSQGAPGRGDWKRESNWWGALALFAYAASFSYAYVRLSVGTGSLILFGAVQVTMISFALAKGERPRAVVWTGLGAALAGLLVLTRPGLSAPDPVGAALMATAGAAWGFYSLLGRYARNPLALTTGNFVRSVPFVLVLSGLTLARAHPSTRGVLLAVASGAAASGLGYTFWYAALPSLSAARAAVAQLSVPPLAATAGVLLLGEGLSVRLMGGGSLILAGVAIAVLSPPRRQGENS